MSSKPKARYIPDKDKFRIGNVQKGYEYLDYKEIKYKEKEPEYLGNGWCSEDKTVEVEKSFYTLMKDGYPYGVVMGKSEDINYDINLVLI